ncbi:MAG: ChbG/HpnK family deacetylase [Candidatus Binatia bacterium]
MTRSLIINADDFGYAQGVNQGIVAAHVQGVVLSTSLMVDAPAVAEAVVLARRYPLLGVGLHFVATNEKEALFDLHDVPAVEQELYRQYQRFCDLLQRTPTHLDSHHHVHLRRGLKTLFVAWAKEHRLPLRGLGAVRYNDKFYGQLYDNEWRPHPDHDLISVENLEKILRALPAGVTELACHPAYLTSDLDSSYATEREIELATLLHPRVGEILRELDITLGNFATLSQR